MINQLGNLRQQRVEIVIDNDMLAWSHLILSHLGCHAVLDLLGREVVASHHSVDTHFIGSCHMPDAVHQTIQSRRAQQLIARQVTLGVVCLFEEVYVKQKDCKRA